MLQFAAVAQQSPLPQQKPFWQWALEQSLDSSQGLPFGRSAVQVPSQCASGSHSPSAVHDVGQVGAVWFTAPVQATGSQAPHWLAMTPVPQPESSARDALDPQTFVVQVASTRWPWQGAAVSQTGSVR